MINEITHACDKLSKTLGLPVNLPHPSKRALRANSIWSFSLGLGLIGASVFTNKEWLALLGGLSITSSIILRLESK